MTRLRGRRANRGLQAFVLLVITVYAGTLLEYFGITHLIPDSIKDGSFIHNQSELDSQPVPDTSTLK
ncbi:MAG: hypothetical protein PUP91_34705 [Rhizonema sp. PD37]|nr:hypothetical protein [Rhizonema sp. PD37]